jgi:hypothetical protein
MPTDLVFRGLDLRGKSFRDQDLTGADFSSADVRGADFTDARLVQANFSDARLGVRPLTGLLILVGALLVSIAAGVTIGYLADAGRDRATSSDWRDILAGSLLALVVVVFLAFLVLKGVRQALRAFLIVFIVVIVVDLVVVFLFAGELRLREGFPLIGLLLLFGPATVAGVLGRVVGGAFGGWAIAIVAVLGGLVAGRAEGGLAAIVVSVLLVLVSKRALKLDERDRPLRQLAHRIVTGRGTRFTGADISGADFTGTLVAQSDVSHATLDGATWERGKGPAAIAETES